MTLSEYIKRLQALEENHGHLEVVMTQSGYYAEGQFADLFDFPEIKTVTTGIRAGESAVKQATDAVKADAWGNTQLTNALMQAEAERDQLRAQLSKAVAEEREACAKVCDDRYMGDNNREDMEAKRCAAAIRARSNT